MKQKIRTTITALILLGFALTALPASAQQKKPNILVIWGDDLGRTNISAYTIDQVMEKLQSGGGSK